MDRRMDISHPFYSCSGHSYISSSRRYRWVAILCLFFLIGCSTYNIGYISDKPIINKDSVFIPNIFLIKSDLPYYCGPESVKAILDHFGFKSSLAVIKDIIYEESNKGTRPSSVISYLREKGLVVELKNGSINDLEISLSKDQIPLIVVVLAVFNKTEADDNRNNSVQNDLRHFLVVTGVNRPDKLLICADYDNKYRIITFEELNAKWSGSNFLQMNVSKPDEFTSLLEKGKLNEQNGSYSRAIKLYEEAVKFKQDDYRPYLHIGNCHYALGNKELALKNYKQAYSLNNSDPVLLNNYATTLLDFEQEIELGLQLIEKSVGILENQYTSEADQEAKQRLLFRYVTSLSTLGEFREYNKDYKFALAAYVKAYELTPEHHTEMRNEKIDRIAGCYKKLGMFASAKEWERKKR